MSKYENRYIITGGPGSGKSSLLNALSAKGYQCFEEISRVIIQEQHKIGGDKVPWENLAEFADICFERMGDQLSECKPTRNCFFDRGLPDIIAYVRRGGLNAPAKYFEKCKDYNKCIFLAPPWKEIFINDDERPESFEDALEISSFLRNTYRELGFTIVELPKLSIKERLLFIEDYLSRDKDSKRA